ncbi:SpoIID/LytB domain-containing protein [Niallia oryzisoli]|uniref:SpoIID/LytB domain-containing protein n=1 Tax=Niallia oryzisoli TaxID=1737571 RepID=A0ABZ2CBJ1_9BACI
MLHRRILSSFLFLVLFISLIPIPHGEAASEPVMQVKLNNYLGNQTQVNLRVQGDYVTSEHKTLLKNNNQYTLKLENGKIKLNQGSTYIGQFDSLILNPAAEGNLLFINQRPYSGSFQFVRETVNKKEVIRPINSIRMEEYLRGVVPSEMFSTWPKEALKAQAVAARTYAFKHNATGIIDDTITFQVYGGFQSYPNSDTAIMETEGQVLKYNGKLIDAVFSASNGGKTESNANAWGGTQVPYFNVKIDDFDPKTQWSFELKKRQIDLTGKSLSDYRQWWSTVNEKDKVITDQIKTWLKNNGYMGKELKIVSIPELSFSAPSSGGRVTKGSITIEFLVKDLVDSSGGLILQRFEVMNGSASKIRAMVGNRTMLSYLVEKTENTTDIIKVQGRGDGHGVGLSQWGAKKRADAGQTVGQILGFYYPGTELITEYTIGIPGMRDVREDYRFYQEIAYLLEKNIITGFPDGNFGPEQTVTRAQAAIMIGRAAGLDGTQRDTIFADVPEASKASGYIASAVEKGIISGFPDKSFRPDEPVTRGQMAIFLAKAFELEREVPLTFTDISENSASYIYIKRILAEGITNGYPDGTYKPERSLKRSEFSAFMARAIDDQFK